MLKISINDIKDFLEIEIIKPQFIIDQETFDSLKIKSPLKKRIPKQMPKDSATAML